MQEILYKCDECGYTTTNRLRCPEWINLEIKSGFVSIENTTMKNGEAFRTISTGEKDFCCYVCMQKWAQRLVSG